MKQAEESGLKPLDEEERRFFILGTGLELVRLYSRESGYSELETDWIIQTCRTYDANQALIGSKTLSMIEWSNNFPAWGEWLTENSLYEKHFSTKEAALTALFDALKKHPYKGHCLGTRGAWS